MRLSKGKHYVFLQRSVPMAERHWIKNSVASFYGALNKQALRILHLFGNDDVKCVRTSVGPEQEYFLITKKMYEQRKDLDLQDALFLVRSRQRDRRWMITILEASVRESVHS